MPATALPRIEESPDGYRWLLDDGMPEPCRGYFSSPSAALADHAAWATEDWSGHVTPAFALWAHLTGQEPGSLIVGEAPGREEHAH